MNPEITNEELIAKREEMLAEMSPEEREATLAVDDAMDRLMVIKLKRMYDADIELIPGDRDHIKVNGVTMGYIEFARWMSEKQGMKDDTAEDADENNLNHLSDFFDA